MKSTTISRTKVSCAINLISALWALERNEEKFKKWVSKHTSSGKLEEGSVYIFSDAHIYSNGDWFVRMIRKHKLGKVKRTLSGHYNPGSGNDIAIWQWVYNGDAFHVV